MRCTGKEQLTCREEKMGCEGCFYFYDKNEIKVGDYVRTKKKGIFKVCSIKKTPYGYYCGTTDNEHIPTFTIGKGGNAEIKNDIVKHSSNIIDLVEVEDYVNGEPVEKIETGLDWGLEITTTTEYITNEEDINSIVTKEQFKSVEFRLED